MSAHRAIDCQGFAGGFTLGTVQAGFELVAKREMGPAPGFGVPNCEANRHLLGDKWKSQVSDPAEWEPLDAEFVLGNPPCSGFSLISNKNFRGPDSPINHCMWAFTNYVSAVNPQVAAFESVQQAFSGGLELMRSLRNRVEERTNESWTLYHVKHNNASCGGSAMRRRYFWLISRIPFGIETPVVHKLPKLHEVLDDLDGLSQTWSPQTYRRPPTWYSKKFRAGATVDGHIGIKWTPGHHRIFDLLESAGPWRPKERHGDIAKRYYEINGTLPSSWSDTQRAKAVSKDFDLGFNQVARWDGNELARVITGAGLAAVVHPNETRLLTHREVARIMGYPDNWKIMPLKSYRALPQTWGKGIPVESGKWIAEWVHRALDGEPGTDQGESMGDREYLIDVTHAYRSAYAKK